MPQIHTHNLSRPLLCTWYDIIDLSISEIYLNYCSVLLEYGPLCPPPLKKGGQERSGKEYFTTQTEQGLRRTWKLRQCTN